MADDARFLRAQIARIRRLLLDSVTDAETERALSSLSRNTRLARTRRGGREDAAEPIRDKAASQSVAVLCKTAKQLKPGPRAGRDGGKQPARSLL
jgi:hypothetical protein